MSGCIMVCVLVFFLLPTNYAVMGASAVAYFFSFVQKESDFLSFM